MVGSCSPQITSFSTIIVEIYLKETAPIGWCSRWMQTGMSDGPTKSLVPLSLWSPEASSPVLVPSMAATHPRVSLEEILLQRKEEMKWTRQSWLLDGQRFLPGCCSLAPAIWVWVEQLPGEGLSSLQPAWLFHPLRSVYIFLRKPLRKVCAVEVNRKASHLSHGGCWCQPGDVPLWWRTVPRESPNQKTGAEWIEWRQE